MDDAPLCLATGCTHAPAPSARLCAVDVQRLGDWIAGLGAAYDRLSAVPSMQAPAAGSVHGGGLKSHRSVGDPDVMVLRDRRSSVRDDTDPDGNRGRGVLEVLGYWAAAVRAERKLTAPTRQIVTRLRIERAEGPLCPAMGAAFTGPALPCAHPSCRAAVLLQTVPAPLTVATERAILATHFWWIVGTDAAGRFYDDLRELAGLLDDANGTACRRPSVPCRCGGRARWVDGAVRCEACGATYQAPVVRRSGAAA